jgi:hypothetical protein
MSNHTIITEPPPGGIKFDTRIFFVKFKPGGGNGNFEIDADHFTRELTDKEILNEIGPSPKGVKALKSKHRGHFDFDFGKATKIAFRLKINNWEFTQLNRPDYDSYPFYLKNPVSHESFRGLRHIERDPKDPNYRTIVLYNLGMENPPSPPPEIHKYGLRINVINRKIPPPNLLTPLEIDPEFKNKG